MSGTLNVEFTSKAEADDFKQRFNKLAPKGGNLIPPEVTGEPEKVRCRGMYVEFKGKKVSFDYAIWDQWSSEFGWMLAIEMTKRYKIKRAGWDSVGWCKTLKDFAKGSKLGFGLERRTLKFLPEGERQKVKEFYDSAIRTFKKAAKRFFDGDASDLILTGE